MKAKIARSTKPTKPVRAGKLQKVSPPPASRPPAKPTDKLLGTSPVIITATVTDTTTGEVFKFCLHKSGDRFAWESRGEWDGFFHDDVDAARKSFLSEVSSYTCGADISLRTPGGPEETREKRMRDLIGQLARFVKHGECPDCLRDGEMPNPECEDHRAFEPDTEDEDAALDAVISRARELSAAAELTAAIPEAWEPDLGRPSVPQ